MKFILEKMTDEHLERVLEIEEASFSEPYTRDLFEEELALKIAHPYVVKLKNKIVGFIDYWIVKDEIQLINIAVDPKYRAKGIGSFLMKHLDEIGIEKKVEKIFLDVRENNYSAIHLYEKFGYEKVRIRKKYYSDDENAIVMVKKISVN